jgi:endogenous inhibitor of DNA gyrase (YacG/DUF329 family)
VTPTRCPICKKPVESPDNQPGARSVFPFCSERCKLIDLGRWLDGRYQIPVSPDPDHESTAPRDGSSR